MTRRVAAAVLAAIALAGCQHEAPSVSAPMTGGTPFWPAYVEAVTSPAPPSWQPSTLSDLLLGPEGQR